MKAITFLFFLMTMTTMTNFGQTPPVEPGVSQSLAKWRAAHYSDVRYKLNVTLEKGAPVLKGTMEMRVKVGAPGGEKAAVNPGAFQILDFTPSIVLDWRKIRGKEDLSTISNVSINGRSLVLNPDAKMFGVVVDGSAEKAQNYFEFNEHLAFADGVQIGENVIKLDFTSPILPSGAAVTRYVDKEDGSEYVYSLFVPSDASTAFPVFDQPDLKAKFTLTVSIAGRDRPDWKVVSNSPGKSGFESTWATMWTFEETKPISTYVFAFAAGDFAEFKEEKAKTKAENLEREKADADGLISDPSFSRILEMGSKDSTTIYVRKSQAEKFKQHAAETFRLNREAVEYLETYFDYKFPFPKYDLVLIPEFPFGGMEHAGATFLRESSVIFPSEPTANDFISRANLIFHEAAHQWFGDTVTMKWFDDLWLKEGFAEFMAYKTLEKVMPEYNAWKAFYERNKPLAYLTDATKGTTPIYQEIPNLSSAKSAYGNIVYRKAPSFLRQAEFYLGEEKFQTAVRAFLKKYQFKNAEWKDLVREFAEVKVADIKKGEDYQKLSYNDKTVLENFTRWSIEEEWAKFWVEKRGAAVYRITPRIFEDDNPSFQMTFGAHGGHTVFYDLFSQETSLKDENYNWLQDVKILKVFKDGTRRDERRPIGSRKYAALPDAERKWFEERKKKRQDEQPKVETEENPPTIEESPKSVDDYLKERQENSKILYVFPNYQDYGYGIFLLDDKSRAYVLENIQNEKDAFLRSMMWGTLWDSVREGEMNPKDYVELAIKNVSVETDELTTSTILSRVSTAMNYYLSDAQRAEVAPRLEKLLAEKLQYSPTVGGRITFYRAFLNVASTQYARGVLRRILSEDLGEGGGNTTMRPGLVVLKDGTEIRKTSPAIPLKSKDRYDIVTRLLILGDPDAPKLLEELDVTDISDDAKRYKYAAGAGVGTKEAKAKYFMDFLSDRNISESWIESAFVTFNSSRHSELTLPFLEKALAELPNLKRSRKIFFVNGWLAAFIGGQKDEKALAVVNKFLNANPNLDKDLQRKILENIDALERAVKIRAKYGK